MGTREHKREHRMRMVGMLLGVTLGLSGSSLARAEVGARLRPLVQRSYRLRVVAGRAYVASTVGLRILDVRRLGRPRLLGTLVVPGSVNDVAIWSARARGPGARRAAAGRKGGGTLTAVAYLAAGPYGVVVADVSDPSRPRRLARLDTRGSANGVALGKHHLYVADGSGGVAVIDATDPRHPRLLEARATGCYAWSATARGRWLYVACGEQGLRVYPIRHRAGAPILGQAVVVRLPGSVQGFAWGPGRTLYVAAGAAGVHVIDARHPRRLHRVATASVEDFARGVSAWGARLAVAAGESGVWLYDLRRRNRPVLRGRYRTHATRSAIGLELHRNRLLVAYDHAGIHLLKVAPSGKLVRRAVFTKVKPPSRPRSRAVSQE